MKFKWTYVLVFLLCLFGTLYFIGTFLETQFKFVQAWITPFADLWANLFASMIVVVIFERIIYRSKIEKNEQSITYVKGRIFGVLIDLMGTGMAPRNWKGKLENPKFNWSKYVNDLCNSRKQVLQELENIVDRYSYLLEPEIMNDVFVLVSVLRSPISNLSDAVSYSVAFISESKKLIERHKLLRFMGGVISFRKGEAPKVSLGKSGVYEPTQYRYYSEWLKDAIAFRDEYNEKYQLKEMKEGSMRGDTGILD